MADIQVHDKKFKTYLSASQIAEQVNRVAT